MTASVATAHDRQICNGAPPAQVAFFGHDRLEPTIRKRLSAFRHGGWSVVGFMFVRTRDGLVDAPASDDTVCLGRSIDRNYLRRLPLLAIAVQRALRRWRDLRAARVIYARNLDMALVAWVSARLAGSRAPLVYEVLDIQRLMLRPDLAGRVARLIERWLLRRSAVLVVSSPDFVTHYFRPIQNYSGAWRLLENKVLAHQLGGMVDGLDRSRPSGPPWVIGWFGTLRCSRSLDLLVTLARELDEDVRIVIAGRLSEEDIDPTRFQDLITSQWNMSFLGAYANPAGLPAIYAGVHFTWAVDYLDDGANSNWLLTNRLYEGGLFGSLALTRADTANGRFAAAKGIGLAFGEPMLPAVSSFLQELSPSKYKLLRRSFEDVDLSVYIDHNNLSEIINQLDIQ